MDWLLAHADDIIPASTDVAPTTPITTDDQAAASASTAEPGASGSATATDADAPEAKSFQCEDCKRLFKNQMEVEYHAAKSGHSNFSESTEEKKPLTEDERRSQMALLEQKIKEKRVEREETEKVCDV